MRWSFSEDGPDFTTRSNALVRRGPIIPIELRNPTKSLETRLTFALIDTGAQANCVSPAMARKMNLRVTDQRRISSVSGRDASTSGTVEVVFGMLRLASPEVEIPSELLVANFQCADPAVRLLLGRPFLKFFDLTYEGGAGRFRLDWSPTSELDQAAV